jgi:phosphoenolpyruvate-protein kinase (PTS system EI component)
MTHVLALAECSPDRAAEVGGKTKGLYSLVARELSIPCVVSTQFATKVLHTGDLIRMDGGIGQIQILDRAPSDVLSSQS